MAINVGDKVVIDNSTNIEGAGLKVGDITYASAGGSDGDVLVRDANGVTSFQTLEVDQLEFGGACDVTSPTVPSTTFNAVPLVIADFYVNVGVGKFSPEWAAVTTNADTNTDANPGDYLVYNGTGFEHIPSGAPPTTDALWISTNGTLEPVNRGDKVEVGGSINNISLDVLGKAVSTATQSTDSSTTLTTKGYVDGLIPTVGNGRITIKDSDGNNVGDFTVNQSGNKDLTLPAPPDVSAVTISDSAPLNPSPEDLWWNSSDGMLYIYYKDVNSSQWVVASPQAPQITDYNDLINTPTIGNGTITITQPGISVDQTFTVNQTGATTIALNDTTYWTLNNNDLYANSDGYNVGIGTQSPGNKLSVHNGDIALVSGANFSGTGHSIKFFGRGLDSEDKSFAEIQGGLVAANTNPDGTFLQQFGYLTFNTSGEERVRLDENGNIGINTNNPQSALHVNGGVRLEGLENAAYLATNENGEIQATQVTAYDIKYKHSRTATERTLQSRLEEYASVKDFGAKGDGSNDTNAINTALDWWASASYRHLHFPEGTYTYSGTKTLDFGHTTLGNILTMDGAINCTSTFTRVFTFTKFSGGRLQLNVNGGGFGGVVLAEKENPDDPDVFLTDTFVDAEPKNGGTVFLTLRAPHTSEIEIDAVNYAGRVLHCTGLDNSAPDKHDSGMSPIYNTISLKGKGRVEGQIGQQFYGDTGVCDVLGAFGSIKIINDGNYYGSVIENCGDVRIETIESGEFWFSAAFEIRGCVNVHCGDIFLGEASEYNAEGGIGDSNDIGKWYNESTGESVRERCLLSIRESKKTTSLATDFDRLSSNIFIDKLNCLNAGTGLNMQNIDALSPGVVINQFNATRCAVPINNRDAWGSVAIRNIACVDCGVILRKTGTGQTAINKNQSYQRYDFLSIGNYRYKNRSAIQFNGHHGLVTLTGNLRPPQIDDTLTGNGAIVNVTGNSTFNETFPVHITNATIDSFSNTDYSCVKCVNYPAGEDNKVRVTDCLLAGNSIFDTTPSYVRGCVGATDTP